MTGQHANPDGAAVTVPKLLSQYEEFYRGRIKLSAVTEWETAVFDVRVTEGRHATKSAYKGRHRLSQSRTVRGDHRGVRDGGNSDVSRRHRPNIRDRASRFFRRNSPAKT